MGMAENPRRLQIVFPEWYRPFWQPARYKIAYGGRGSGKSTTFARALICMAAERPIRVLCARELQNSIQDSVHQLISDQIADMQLSPLFRVQEKAITSAAGGEFLFKGVRGTRGDASQLKSLEGVDICWIEEGQTISRASMETLTPTIRKPGSEIWITYNPDQESDPVHQLAMNPPEGSVVRKVNFDENPWFPETLDLERRWMQRTDPDAYAHVWLGECRQYTDAQVLRGKWVVDAFTPGSDWNGPYYGADWGYAQDPTTLERCWINDGKLYIEHEAWQVGCEIDATPALFDTVPESRQHIIRADSARPETISYMRRQGFRITAVKKGRGSVEDGVAHLRGYEQIIIHPRCTHTADEARLWSFKVDKLTGDVLPRLVDKNNHCWDGVRYALEPIIRAGTSGGQFAGVIRRTIT
jgi:phage terminase large subunit